MDVHEALYTTRMMRRLRPDPIPLDTQARILDAAVRAPNGETPNAGTLSPLTIRNSNASSPNCSGRPEPSNTKISGRDRW